MKLILLSVIAFMLACYSVVPNPVDIKQRGVICNLQEYTPETAKVNIELCRLGLTKETQK